MADFGPALSCDGPSRSSWSTCFRGEIVSCGCSDLHHRSSGNSFTRMVQLHETKEAVLRR
ncbi:hypothetical protein SynRCC2555_01466 [Synechococcus sp. WH 8101]|nr:hypothetical protein SynRCC2555_01466 [Synechococcus sp. WH 8101]